MTTIYPHLTVYDVGSCLCMDYTPNAAISHKSTADISSRHLAVCSVAAFVCMSAFGCGIWLDCACSAFDTSFKYVCVCVCVCVCCQSSCSSVNTYLPSHLSLTESPPLQSSWSSRSTAACWLPTAEKLWDYSHDNQGSIWCWRYQGLTRAY